MPCVVLEYGIAIVPLSAATGESVHRRSVDSFWWSERCGEGAWDKPGEDVSADESSRDCRGDGYGTTRIRRSQTATAITAVTVIQPSPMPRHDHLAEKLNEFSDHWARTRSSDGSQSRSAREDPQGCGTTMMMGTGQERGCANHRARASPKAFSRRITESCSNGTIIVIIMNLCNFRFCIRNTRDRSG